MKKYWYLAVLWLAVLIIDQHVVQWGLAIKVGGYSVAEGFEEAFGNFSVSGYLFFTAFRVVPYVGLGAILVILSNTKYRDYVTPVFIGGLIGILAMIIWQSWMAMRPYYTDEHVSSTTAIAFLVIPVCAVPTGAIGAVLSASLYALFRYVIRKRKTEPSVSGDA